MSFANYEKSGYHLDLALLTILHKLCVSYPTRSGNKEPYKMTPLPYNHGPLYS